MSAILVFYSSSDLSDLVASAFACHKMSAHHQFANGTYFTASALVLKFSAFFQYLRNNVLPHVHLLQHPSLTIKVIYLDEKM